MLLRVETSSVCRMSRERFDLQSKSSFVLNLETTKNVHRERGTLSYVTRGQRCILLLLLLLLLLCGRVEKGSPPVHEHSDTAATARDSNLYSIIYTHDPQIVILFGNATLIHHPPHPRVKYNI